MVDVVSRVRGVRGYAVQLMVRVLSDEGFLVGVGENEEGGCGEVLWGAAWICGEYCRYVSSIEYYWVYLTLTLNT